MRFLITNDDGVNSEGLKLLAEKVNKYGDVIVVAPFREQSAKSHAITIRKGLEFYELDDIVDGVKTYAVNGTPADCVRVARYYLKDNFDVVLSGINNGFNLGEDILYSGTVGAATEGVQTKAKAIAFSSKYNSLEYAEEWFDRVFTFIFDNGLLDRADLINVNFPLNPRGIKIAKQGSTFFETHFPYENDLVWQKGKPNFDLDKDPDTDVYNINNSYITVTPLLIDRTDYKAFEVFKTLVK